MRSEEGHGMRLVTYRQEPYDHVGVLDGDRVYPVRGQKRVTMLDLIDAGETDIAAELAATARPLDLEQLQIVAPIPHPRQNIIGLGRNYLEHAQEMERSGREKADAPTFFTKAVTSVIGPYETIPYDSNLSTEIDWEVELAVVIGQRAKNVHRGDAMPYVFGYMVLNDISARDLQYGFGGQYFYGKSLDGSCPMGPCIITADEVPDPQDLRLQLRVNGVTKQDARTSSMILDVAGIIERLSAAMTLLPGQIIATGTPPGVGSARTPKEYLRPGDVMESEIDGVGVLRNEVGTDYAAGPA